LKFKNLICLVLSVFTFIFSMQASAHHSTTMFDREKVLTISGTVKEVQWTNPHVAIFVFGTINDGDTPALWLMEMTSPGNLVRAGGWSRNAVKAGDKVVVDFSPLRNGAKENYLSRYWEVLYS